MGQELSYSFHLGSDKNKSKIAKKVAKDNVSGTTSLVNNAIQNAKNLSDVNKHNLRDYDNKKELIRTILGTNDIVKDVQNLYLIEFEEARIEYNNNQTRNDRKIENYFEKVCLSQNDIACEIIIELGDMDFWNDKNQEYRLKMIDVFAEQITDLNSILPTFKIANATIHFDETSPHMHLVGVPVIENCSRGMKKKVGKSKLFTKETLTIIQDKMRVACIKSFNKFYDIDYKLKEKGQGRNVDIKVSEMKNYRTLKLQEKDKKQRFVDANKKIDNLGKETKKINDILNELKPSRLNKNNNVISNESVERIRKYGENVLETAKSLKSVEELNEVIKDVEKDLNNHKNQVNDLKWTIHSLNYQLQEKDEKIARLNKKLSESERVNSKLRKELDTIKEAFSKVKQVLKGILKRFKAKIIYDKDVNYINVVKDLKNSGILSDDDSDMILNPSRKIQTPDEKMPKDKKKNDLDIR